MVRAKARERWSFALPHHKQYRIGYYLAAFISIAAMSGTILGWPSMRAMLRRDGVLAESCAEDMVGAICVTQELKLGLIYSFASWAAQGGRFFVGIFLDKYGPRATVTLSIVTFATGSILVALSLSIFGGFAEAGMGIGFFLVAFGGAGVQLSLQSVSALFPKNRSLVMSTLTGAYQLASGVYLIFDALHGIASLFTMLLVHAGVAGLFAIAAPFFWPALPFNMQTGVAQPQPQTSDKLSVRSSTGLQVSRSSTSLQMSFDEVMPLTPRDEEDCPFPETERMSLPDDAPPEEAPTLTVVPGAPQDKTPHALSTRSSEMSVEQNRMTCSQMALRVSITAVASSCPPMRSSNISVLPVDGPPPRWLPLRRRPFRQQASSPQFVLLICFFTLNMLQCQFTIGSIGAQLDVRGDHGTALLVFSVCLSCTIVFCPLIGVMLDRLGFIVVFTVANTVLIASTGLLLLPYIAAQYAMAVFYSFGRAALMASYFSYLGATFGFYHYGKLAGGGLLISATVSLLQYPLLDTTLGWLGGDFNTVNYIFLGLSVTQYPVIWGIYKVECARRRRESAAAIQSADHNTTSPEARRTAPIIACHRTL